MSGATYAIPSFHGGEISQYAQGRFDKPDYRLSLNVCLNSFPVEIGTWTRRPGSRNASHTRGGNPGRTMEFDFEQSSPVTMEFTDGWLRFRSGPMLLTTNDAQIILAISAANPAVVQAATPHGWSTGNTVVPSSPSVAILENRQFTITVVDTTHFSLQDSLTGVNIDGSTLGALTAGASIKRVQELQTSFTSGSWAVSSLRQIQAETTTVLLNGSIAPQAVTVSSLPAGNNNAIFAINPANFLDGPYLDAVNGSLVTPSGVSGIISLTLSVQLYSSSTAYNKGDLASSGGISYQSLQGANVNNTPASSPTFWMVVSPGVAVGPTGFLPTDIGRLIRIFNPSLAPPWSSGTTYNAGDLATQSSIGYRALIGNNTNNTPSATSSFWEIYSPGWTWGKITSLSTTGFISGSLAGAVHFGTMAAFGGLSAAFDGTTSKTLANCAVRNYLFNEFIDTLLVLSDDIGQNYSGASAQAISSVILYPSTDHTFLFVNNQRSVNNSIFNLRGKATAPASTSDGTLLATTTLLATNTNTAITLVSTDNVTTWNYVWIEVITSVVAQAGLSTNITPNFAQVQFFGPGGIVGSIVNLEILGAPLPNTNTSSWLLGAFSATSGYPTCGCYDEGRIWLGGAISNRFDAGVSNGISGNTLNFAPTDNTGQVLASSAISYTLNSDSVNPILAMRPDLQGVIIWTQNGEWLVQAPTTGPIAADNIAARRITKHGSENIEPVRTPHANIFVKRYARKLLEYFADAFSGKYSAPNLSDKAEHIVTNGIAEITFTEATNPILWGYDVLGSLFGVTYKRDALVTSQPPDFYGWHRHVLGSGRVVESICSGASVGGDLDALTMVTNDPVTNIRHVEVLTDVPNETTALADSWFLDDAVTPSSTSTTNVASNGFPYGGLTINGLWHLNGKTVQVFAGGLDCGDRGTTGYTDFVVSNGTITVPYGDSISSGPGRGLFTAAFAATANIVIGCTYNSDGQLVRQISPADSGARNGPALGKIRRGHRYAALLVNTLGISFGTSFSKLFPAIFRPNGGTLAPLTTFSGIHQDTLADDYGYDGMMCFRVSRPFPANIAAISGNLETQDQ